MVIKKISFLCGICEAIFDTEKEAEKCEAQGTDASEVKVGDIVFTHAGFNWFDGDRKWISNPKALDPREDRCKHNCFAPCCTYRFYFVVTKIDLDAHRTRYHLATKAMSGTQGYRSGYTYNRGHFKPELVKNPPRSVVKDSKDLIGQEAEHLLN